MGINPIVLEIIRGSLRSTIQEMELLMERCAMSPFIKEKKDYFVGIYDTRSRIVLLSYLLQRARDGGPHSRSLPA
jgi:N-methylhydantoinase B